MVVVEGWSLPIQSEKLKTNRNTLPIEGLFKVWENVRKYENKFETNIMKKCVPCRSPRRCPPYFLIITAFNYFRTTSYYFLLLLTDCWICWYYMLTTSLLLFLLMFNMLLLCVYNFFTTCLLLFTRLLLLLYYMFTTCYYMFTASLLHVCYFLFVLLHFTNGFIRWYYFLLLFNILYNVLLFLYIFTVWLRLWYSYPVVIITWVHYLGPPGPSTSQILGTFSRFSETFLAERERGGSLGP